MNDLKRSCKDVHRSSPAKSSKNERMNMALRGLVAMQAQKHSDYPKVHREEGNEVEKRKHQRWHSHDSKPQKPNYVAVEAVDNGVDVDRKHRCPS